MRYMGERRREPRVCEWCSKGFMGTPPTAAGKVYGAWRFCSRRCAWNDASRKSMPVFVVECSICGALRTSRRRVNSATCGAATCVNKQVAWRARGGRRQATTCGECGATIDPAQPGKWRRFCGKPCHDRASNRTERRRRRTRLKGVEREGYTHLEIATRDGWRCHLCGRRVTRENWSVDHLVPLAAGGPDTRANVALAHHRCNMLRSDRGPAQLRLMG